MLLAASSRLPLLHTHAPNGVSPPPGNTKYPSTLSHDDGGSECGSAGANWDSLVPEHVWWDRDYHQDLRVDVSNIFIQSGPRGPSCLLDGLCMPGRVQVVHHAVDGRTPV